MWNKISMEMLAIFFFYHINEFISKKFVLMESFELRIDGNYINYQKYFMLSYID